MVEEPLVLGREDRVDEDLRERRQRQDRPILAVLPEDRRERLRLELDEAEALVLRKLDDRLQPVSPEDEPQMTARPRISREHELTDVNVENAAREPVLSRSAGIRGNARVSAPVETRLDHRGSARLADVQAHGRRVDARGIRPETSFEGRADLPRQKEEEDRRRGGAEEEQDTETAEQPRPHEDRQPAALLPGRA
jgi:hypothetical protein